MQSVIQQIQKEVTKKILHEVDRNKASIEKAFVKKLTESLDDMIAEYEGDHKDPASVPNNIYNKDIKIDKYDPVTIAQQAAYAKSGDRTNSGKEKFDELRGDALGSNVVAVSVKSNKIDIIFENNSDYISWNIKGESPMLKTMGKKEIIKHAQYWKNKAKNNTVENSETGKQDWDPVFKKYSEMLWSAAGVNSDYSVKILATVPIRDFFGGALSEISVQDVKDTIVNRL